MACCRCDLASILEATGPMCVECRDCGVKWQPSKGTWLVPGELAWIYFEPLCEHGLCSLFLIDVDLFLNPVRCRSICKDGHQCRNGATNGGRCFNHGGGKKKRGS